MGFLKGIFGGQKEATSTPDAPAPECGHATLIPRWDNAEDMGKAERVTVYQCESCGEEFSPLQVERMRA